MIPCIKNKCILYPTCIDKVEIECSDLEEYFNELYIAYEDFKDTISEIWKTINKTYPNLKKYLSEQKEIV